MTMFVTAHSAIEKEMFAAHDVEVETSEGSAASDDETSSSKSWNSHESPETGRTKGAQLLAMLTTLAPVMPAPEPAMCIATPEPPAPTPLRTKLSSKASAFMPVAAFLPTTECGQAEYGQGGGAFRARLSSNAAAFVPQFEPAAPQWGCDWAAPAPACGFGWEEQACLWNPEESLQMPAFYFDPTAQVEAPWDAAACPAFPAAPAPEPATAGAQHAPQPAVASEPAKVSCEPAASKQEAKTLVPEAKLRPRWADLLDEDDDDLEVDA